MKITGRKRVYDGFIKVDELTLEDESGKTFSREVAVSRDAVAALVFDTEKKSYIFVNQFRPGVCGYIPEIVAGTMDVEGERPEDCIKREIREETGYEVDSISYITTCYFSPGRLTEQVHIFYAEVSRKTSSGGGVGDEGIDVVVVPEDAVMDGRYVLNDCKSVIAVQWVLMKNMLETAK